MATPRKTAPRKAIAAKAQADVDQLLATPIEPVRITKREPEDIEMVTLFELDGREYTVPAKPGPALILRYIRESRKIGAQEAGLNVLNAMIGDEAIEALSESPDVTAENVKQIYDIVGKLFFEGMVQFGKSSGN